MTTFAQGGGEFTMDSGRVLWKANLFEVPRNAGRVIAITGPTGCGKSTLVRILAGLQVPGSLKLVRDESVRVGYLTQRAILFPGLTAAENMRVWGRLEAQREAVARTAPMIDMLAQRFRLDFGELSQRWEDWSGGELQRLTILRTLSTDPEVLLLDEPCTGIDPVTRLEVGRALREWTITNQRTTVYVTHHHDEVLQIADEVISFEGIQPPFVVRQSPLALSTWPQESLDAALRSRPDLTMLPAVLRLRNGVLQVCFGPEWIAKVDPFPPRDVSFEEGERVWVVIQPTSLRLGDSGSPVTRRVPWFGGLDIVETSTGTRLVIASAAAGGGVAGHFVAVDGRVLLYRTSNRGRYETIVRPEG